MAEDPRHPWGTGKTTHSWVGPVRQIVHRIERNWPQVRCNSYICHPWCGWSRYSIDVWSVPGRGSPLSLELARTIRTYLMGLPGQPLIRHTILGHELWTSWGGYSFWRANDHSGSSAHLHITYWK